MLFAAQILSKPGKTDIYLNICLQCKKFSLSDKKDLLEPISEEKGQ